MRPRFLVTTFFVAFRFDRTGYSPVYAKRGWRLVERVA